MFSWAVLSLHNDIIVTADETINRSVVRPTINKKKSCCTKTHQTIFLQQKEILRDPTEVQLSLSLTTTRQIRIDTLTRMATGQVFFHNIKLHVPDIKSSLVITIVVVLGLSSNLASSKNVKLKETCTQIGQPEENVTLMYGLHNENVKHALIGHVKTLKECVSIACKRENASLAYTSRFDCYSVTCHGDEELCWLLPSFNNPSLVFARLDRKRMGNDDVKITDKDKDTKKTTKADKQLDTKH